MSLGHSGIAFFQSNQYILPRHFGQSRVGGGEPAEAYKKL